MVSFLRQVLGPRTPITCNLNPHFLFERKRSYGRVNASIGKGDCLAAKLRPDNVHSAEDWDEVVVRACIGIGLQRVGISSKHHHLAQFLLASISGRSILFFPREGDWRAFSFYEREANSGRLALHDEAQRVGFTHHR